MKKLCCVFNYNPLYRLPIYQAMSENFDCDFYFGDTVFAPLKGFDPKELNGFKRYLNVSKFLRAFVWYSDIHEVLKRQYTHYIVTGSHEYIGNWIIILYAKLTGKKVIGWGHGPKQFETNFKRRFLRKLFFRFLDHILLYNNYNIKFLEFLGVNNSKISVIHNSLNTELQTKLYKKLTPSGVYKKHFGNDNPTVIYIGRIQKRMKVEMLIEALLILKENGSIVNAVIVGSYLDGVNIEELVKEKGLAQQVWLYGPSFDEEINSELLFNADVCVAPGTVGLTAIHALSYGTPCITHSNHSETGPEFEAIKEGVTGSFFKENSVESLVEAISKWINLPSAKRDNIRNVARQEVENNWSVESQIKLLTSILS